MPTFQLELVRYTENPMGQSIDNAHEILACHILDGPLVNAINNRNLWINIDLHDEFCHNTEDDGMSYSQGIIDPVKYQHLYHVVIGCLRRAANDLRDALTITTPSVTEMEQLVVAMQGVCNIHQLIRCKLIVYLDDPRVVIQMNTLPVIAASP